MPSLISERTHLDPAGSRRFPVGRSSPRSSPNRNEPETFISLQNAVPLPRKRRSIEFSGIIGHTMEIHNKAAFRDPIPASFQSLRNCERTRPHLYMVFTLLLSVTRGQLLLSNATKRRLNNVTAYMATRSLRGTVSPLLWMPRNFFLKIKFFAPYLSLLDGTRTRQS